MFSSFAGVDFLDLPCAEFGVVGGIADTVVLFGTSIGRHLYQVGHDTTYRIARTDGLVFFLGGRGRWSLFIDAIGSRDGEDTGQLCGGFHLPIVKVVAGHKAVVALIGARLLESNEVPIGVVLVKDVDGKIGGKRQLLFCLRSIVVQRARRGHSRDLR